MSFIKGQCSIIILLCALLLPACGPLSAGAGKSDASAPPPAPSAPDAPFTVSTDAPPDAGSRPDTAGGSSATPETTTNGMPNLQPKGVELQKLFSEDIKDPTERIKRVENAVLDMRRDFDAVLPSIVRLVAVEQDMQDLTKQLGTLLQNEPQTLAAAGGSGGAGPSPLPPGIPSVPAVKPAPVTATPLAPANVPPPPPVLSNTPGVPTPPPADTPPVASTAPVALTPPNATDKLIARAASTASASNTATAAAKGTSPAVSSVVPPPAPAPAAPKPAPARASATPDGKILGSGAAQVRDLRIGEHPGETRLVLDVSGKSAYAADLDNDEHLLVVDLPDSAWAGPKKGSNATSPLIESWTVQPGEQGKGSRRIMVLKKDAQITKQSALPAANGEPYKIVIDLK